MGIVVLNIDGRDSNISYKNGIGLPEMGTHAPVNYHAYAACSNGTFLNSLNEVQPGDDVIFLLRSDLKTSLKKLDNLKKKFPESKVLLLFKETSPYQILKSLKNHKNIDTLNGLGKLSDGFISPTPFMIDFLKNFTNKTVAFIPTPYPFHDKNWTVNKPFSERKNILLGTKEFDVQWRMHLITLTAIRKWVQKHNIQLSIINKDGRKTEKLLFSIGFNTTDFVLIDGIIPYADYLQLLGSHRLVFNFDMGFVPGQISGDSLLTSTPVLGGNSAIQNLVYPEWVTHNLEYQKMLDVAEKIYFNESFFNQTNHEAQTKAEQFLTFEKVKSQLFDLFQKL